MRENSTQDLTTLRYKELFMKFLVLLMLLATSAFAEEGPHGQNVLVDGLGNIKGPKDQFFIYVKNGEGATISPGSVTVLDVADDDGVSVEVVTTATARPHCVMVDNCTTSKRTCKCQTYGYTDLLLFHDDAGGDATAGEFAFIDTSSQGYARARVQSGGGDVFSHDNFPIGIFYDSSADDGAVEAFIDLR